MRFRLTEVNFTSVKSDFQLLLNIALTQLLPKAMLFKQKLYTLKILRNRWSQNEDLFKGLCPRSISKCRVFQVFY